MTVLRMMRGKKAALTMICALMVMILAAGCGRKDEKPVPVDLSSEELQGPEEDNPDRNPVQDAEEDNPDRNSAQDAEEDNPDRNSAQGAEGDKSTKDLAQGTEDGPEKNQQDHKDEDTETNTQEEVQTPVTGKDEIEGNVRSIGQDSFVISKTTTYAEGDALIAVGVAPGAEGEELITVYVNKDCVYQYQTVKNSGINPEDISVREGSFGDVTEGIAVDIKGSWQDGAFYADSMVMREFVR